MTTLPQTTHFPRIPRPGGIVVHSPNGPIASANGAAASHVGTGMTPADAWRVIRSNWVLIVGALVVSLGLGYAANMFLAAKFPRYTSIGYVQVQQPMMYNPLDKSNQPLTSYDSLAVELKTQAQLLKTDSLFSNVLADPNLDIRNTSWFKQFVMVDSTGNQVPDVRAAKQDLQDHFSANPVTDSKLIAVSMSFSDARDARTVVYDIVNKHLADQDTASSRRQADRTTQLTTLRNRIRDHINNLNNQLRETASKLQIDGSSPSNGRISAVEIQLEALVTKQMDLQEQLTAAQTQYSMTEQQLQQGVDPSMVDRIVQADPQVLSLKQQLSNIEISVQTAIAAVGPNNHQTQLLETQRDKTRQQYERVEADARANARVQVRDMMTSAVESNKQGLEQIKKQIEGSKDQLGQLTITMADYMSKQDDLRAENESLKIVNDQLEQLTSATTNTTTVSWMSTPVAPDDISFPKLPLTLAAAGFIGLSLSLGIAFLRELMDNTVRSPRDIAKVGPMNVLGLIPHVDEDPQADEATLATALFQAPMSMTAEQYRQVRTKLQQAASLDTTRSILVTSPSPGDGKTVVACNLAAGLALNGRRILLVDANFRRPELHRIYEVDNNLGLSNVMGSLENFESAVKTTQVPNLDVLPAGPKPQNPTELLESQLLIDLIERALEEYDHVIFDTGPLLFVSETVALAPRVDGVITVIRAATNTRGLLQRLRDGLKQLKAEHLGVILNGVRNQAGGYYNRNIKTYYEYQNVTGATK